MLTASFGNSPVHETFCPADSLFISRKANPNPNPNLDTKSRAHYVLSATPVAEDVTWWLVKDGHVTRRRVAQVWLSVGTCGFHKK